MRDEPSIEILPIRGPDIAPYLDDLAALRIRVFRDFPYLYDGDRDYERQYLQTCIDSPHSLAVLVRSGSDIVGASTCVPLSDEDAAFRQPFEYAGIDTGDVFYLAESVLLPEFRGRGIGRRFFDQREAHARSLGNFRYTAFCAVERPAYHPRRPTNYRPLDPFWQSRGYREQPHLQAHFPWRDLDDAEETEKTLTFWLRELNP